MPEAPHIAFVCPRFPDGRSAGGAETLLRKLAERTAASARRVTFLTTCATDHFTWANAMPPGRRTIGPLDVCFFSVDKDRNVQSFNRIQERISNGWTITPEDEDVWLRNGVRSLDLCRHLEQEGDRYDRIVAGPYLFGLVVAAAGVRPDRTLLVPCLHDEPFARLHSIRRMFGQVRGFLFNSEPERLLSVRLYDINPPPQSVVGMGIDPFTADGERFCRRHGLTRPYLLYSGRRETLKGTPMLMDYWWAFRRRTGKDLAIVLTGSGPVEFPPDAAPHILDLGFASEQDKHDAMAGAFAFCQPSRYESLSIVALEAWMAGAAVLVHSDCEVLRYQCRRSGGGLWFSDYPEFEETLLHLMAHPEERRAMAEAGKRFVLQEYRWDAVEKRLWTALDA